MDPSPRIAFLASPVDGARQSLEALAERHGQHAPEEADVLVALGGDGFMLQTLHRHGALGKPVYGMKHGGVGFLMNQHDEDALVERLHAAEPAVLRPLEMLVMSESGASTGSLAYNEVSLLRQTRQAAHLSIELNGKPRLEELIADGVMVSTPAGSTAYNYSAHGPILPLGSSVIALTPIAPFRPRRWRGALLPDRAHVTIKAIDPVRRPVAAVADHAEVRSVREVEIAMDHTISIHMLFDPGHSLDERILREQFGY
jgi:NAD+ kinase